MTVPSRVAAARLLLSLDPPAWHVRHARAVAEVAAWVALRVQRHGDRVVDRLVVETAALLHDVDKTLPLEERGSRPHGEAGAAWLAAAGYPELAEPVALHPVSRLTDPLAGATMAQASLEARIVAYADKRAGQRLERMEARFASWRRRDPEGWSEAEQARAFANAIALEADVCERGGCSPDQVARLPWTFLAFRTAEGQPASEVA